MHMYPNIMSMRSSKVHSFSQSKSGSDCVDLDTLYYINKLPGIDFSNLHQLIDDASLSKSQGIYSPMPYEHRRNASQTVPRLLLKKGNMVH